MPHRTALFLQIILTGGHEVIAIDYCIGGRVVKLNICLLALLNFTLLVVILLVKSPCTLTIIARDAPLVLLVVAGHGDSYQIFGIWSTGFIVTHSGSSFIDFFGVLPLEPCPVDLQSFLIWPFLSQL